MPVKDGLREAGGAGGEVYGGVIVLAVADRGAIRGTVADDVGVVQCVGGSVLRLSHIEERRYVRELIPAVVDAVYELRSEDQHLHVRQVRAVGYLVRRVAVIHGHHDGTGLEDSEVYREPFDAVHQQDRHLVALSDLPGQKKVRETVGLKVEFLPGDLPSVMVRLCGLDEGIFYP